MPLSNETSGHPSTVQTIRLKHRILHKDHQSHPLQISGYLTIPQIAKKIGVSKHWIYDRINNKRIAIRKDPKSGSYLFPDKYETIDLQKKIIESANK